MFYPYRTTVDKLVEAQEKIVQNGDAVVSAHHVAGRDWVILARKGQHSPELQRPELERIWHAIHVLAYGGPIAVASDPATGRGATNAVGVAGVRALHEILNGTRLTGCELVDGPAATPTLAGPWKQATD